MTAVSTTSAPSSSRTEGRLGPRLEEMHRQWLQDLRARVENTKAKDRNVWQFDGERRVIGRITEGPVLWVAGELVSNLRWQLRNSVGLCHHHAEFSLVMGKLVRALEYWFAAVEEVVGATRWADLSAETRRELASLGIEAREELDERELDQVRDGYARLAERTRADLRQGQRATSVPDVEDAERLAHR